MEKLFYKIGEISQIAGLKPFVLRFWETEFPSLYPKKSEGGQRVYTKKELELVLEIKKLLYKEGLTIPGARKRLEERKPLKEIPQNTLGVVKKELEEIYAILS